MTDTPSDAERMQRVGLFNTHETLAGLLREVAAFLDQHGIASPHRFEHHRHANRGWQVELALAPADFLRILTDYPMPIRFDLVQEEADAPRRVRLETDVRAGRLSTVIPLHQLAGRITSEGLLLALGGKS